MLVLVVGETAEGQVVPNLWRLVAQLDQPLIQLQSDLWLLPVKVVGRHIGHCLDIAVLHRKSSFVALM